jgi:tetratricopeptide (TPR) repeat protein
MTKYSHIWQYAKKIILVFAVSLPLLACSTPEQKSEAHTKSGNELLEAGDLTRASIEFRNALKYDDKNADAWMGLANVEEQRQNWPIVAQSLQRVVELKPSNADALLRLAKLKFASLRLDEALKGANAADQLKPNDPDILALRAAILLRLNDVEGAKGDAERALAINPNSPDANAVLAAERMQANDSKGALLFVDRGLATDSKNIALLLFKLKIFETTENYQGIEDILKFLVANYPEQSQFKQAIVSFLLHRNREDEAITQLRGMVDQNLEDTNLALDLVRLVGRIKGSAAGREELARLAASRPTKVDFKLALAQLDFGEKRTDDALKTINEIIAKGEPKEDVARARLVLAEISKAQGKVQEAKDLVKTVLEADAKNADGLAIRASISLDENRYDEAVADLREALNQKPDSSQFLLMLSRAHELQGAVELAMDRLSEAVKLSQFNPEITMRYLDLLKRRGKADRIEPVLEDALKRQPNNKQFLAAMAQVKLTKQDWAGAEEIAVALKKLGDGSGLDLQISGAAQIGANKLDDSIDTLKSAYELAPQATSNLYSVIYAYLRAGKVAEAEQFLASVLSANPNSGDAHALRGTILVTQKKVPEAEASLRKAIEVQPANAVGYAGLSNLYLSQRKIDEAEAVLKAGTEKVKGNLSLSLSLAGIREAKGDIEGAITIYEEQLKATPDAFIIVNNLASLLADYRTDEESLNRAYVLSQRLESMEVPQFLDTMGWIAYRKGDLRTALMKLEKAAEQLPKMALVHYHLAQTYEALKRGADAKARYETAAALLTDGDPLKEKILKAVAAIQATTTTAQ